MNNHAPGPCILIFLLLVSGCVQGQNRGNNEVGVKHTADFEVTGTGSAAAWKSAEWIDLTKRKGLSQYTTRAKLLYSDSGIYALFSSNDEKITASLKEDFTNLWTEDVVEIFFWPDESVPLYFEYELSPLNHELAILVPNLDGDFLGWKPWQYEGPRKTRHEAKVLTDNKQQTKGWVGEFFIPYALLKPLRNVPPVKGSTWRVNLYRIDYDQEYSSWTWQPVEKNFHDYKRFGVMRFE